MNIEELRAGASVVSRDGHAVGTLHRFVIDKETYALTHLVVDTGVWRSGDWKNGWGLSHDRVVPLGVLDSTSADEIHLTMSGEEFKDLSRDFIEEGFARIHDWEPGRLDASDVARITSSFPGEPGPYFMYDVEAHGTNEVDIAKDTAVWRMRPHEKIGEVERVLFDGDTSRLTALVIKRGAIFSKEVVLPMADVTEVTESVVRVDLDDASLNALAEYHAEE